jgi:hypothetical protein
MQPEPLASCPRVHNAMMVAMPVLTLDVDVHAMTDKILKVEESLRTHARRVEQNENGSQG